MKEGEMREEQKNGTGPADPGCVGCVCGIPAI